MTFQKSAHNRVGWYFLPLLLTIWVIQLKQLGKPIFRSKDHGPGAGIPVLKTIWDFFDMALLFSQTGISKHSGLPAWLMAFAYICGLINNVKSANKNASFSADAPFLRHLLGQKVSQSALSRFLAKPFAWLQFSLGRVARLQEKEESRLIEGDVIALDDTKIEHRHGKKDPLFVLAF